MLDDVHMNPRQQACPYVVTDFWLKLAASLIANNYDPAEAGRRIPALRLVKARGCWEVARTCRHRCHDERARNSVP